jgi:hypothetical protein
MILKGEGWDESNGHVRPFLLPKWGSPLGEMTGLLFFALKKDDLQPEQSFRFPRKRKPPKPALRQPRK